ncbi:MAG: DNA-protecting protein DprA [Anaerolineae bacterium]|jgi:DNA processing protein|nr:DNA-protecting protein DprA [Anaerolineae bacterium]
MSDELAWIALSLTEHLGGKTLRALLTHFNGDVQAILNATHHDLIAVPGVGKKTAAAIQAIDLVQAAQAVIRWQQDGIQTLTWNHPAYPQVLKKVEDRPPILFYRGTWRLPPDPFRAVAIVGTRTPTVESIKRAYELAHRFAQEGAVIISGLALGIDTAAHQGAIDAGGITLAVLGNGIMTPYPPENKPLATRIQWCGGLIAEVAPHSAVTVSGLVARNRIITGLVERVIIAQSEVDGGAMHAARFAIEQGRLLYAVDNQASGNRHLLAQGAHAI